MEKKKIIILVLSVDLEPWNTIEQEGIRKTWCRTESVPDDVEVLFYYGGPPGKIGDRVFFDIVEDYGTIGLKTLEAFRYVKNNYDFDFVFRTNTSSYVDIVNLKKHLEKFNAGEDLYCGVKCVPPPGDPRPIFASGCGYTLSRRTLSKVLENHKKWDHSQIDDLALAKLMISLGIPVTNAPRCDINHPHFAKSFNKTLATGNFHVRCKTEAGDMNRLNDVHTMRAVHSVYQELGR